MRDDMSLDVASPEAALKALRNAAERFYADGAQLADDWQDTSAGRPWAILAREVEAARTRAIKAMRKAGYPVEESLT